MHASRVGGILAAALLSRAGIASPVFPRETDSALSPWASVDASGIPVATITPLLTSINGVATTIRPAPAALIATETSSQTDSKPTDTSSSNGGGGAYYPCQNKDGDLRPFCKPDNGSVVYVGTTYYVTWDPQYFGEKNASIYVMADYDNTTGGPIAFQSSIQSTSTGFLAWSIPKEWLQNQETNNITLFINPINPVNGEAVRLQGPSLMVTKESNQYYHQPPTKAPTGESLYIALPVVFGFILVCLCGGCYLNRKHRQIGLPSVMGRRKGYGIGRSRGQRLRLSRKKGRSIQLREQNLSPDGQYRDAPLDREEQRNRQREAGRPRTDSDLGSLAESLVEERANYFRNELRRQEQARH